MKLRIFCDRRENENLTFMEPYIANVFLSTTNEMQRYTVFFIVLSALHVSSGFSADRRSDLTRLAVTTHKFDKYRCCMSVFELLMMGGKTARNM
jgi:hypothetical protein